ncbi:MAG: hypothetical protein WA966_14175 [Ornithinimicrobium sp.]
MKSVRSAAVCALSSVLLISACSDSDSQSTSQDATSTAAADDAAATSDGSAATQQPGDEAGATAPGQDVAVMSVEDAEAIASDLLTKAALVGNGDGKEIEEDVDGAFRGSTAVAALAADELESVSGAPDQRDLIANPVEPNVLAISREDDDSPMLLLVQTVAESGAPELYVMAGSGAADSFRIVWWAPMLPGTDIGTFDRRSEGSPILREGKGDLSQSPKELLTAFGASIDYPVGEDMKVKTNGYAPQVRKAAQTQAADVSEQADYTESNTLKTQTYTFFREDGSAVTFATLKRESDFDVREGMELTPPDEFLVFEDDSSITSQARLNTYVSVAMTIPTDSDRPEMIAAREQLVSASGS